MKIVASNSLTLSNVNDGTITHVAYANSADGKDGFTTVYPKPNLLNGTKVHDIFKGTGTANAGGTQRYTLDKSLKISDLKLSKYQDLIFEFDWKATGANPSGSFVYQTQTYYKGTRVDISPENTSGHVKNNFYNLPVTTDISTFINIRQDNIPTTVTVEISNLMMYIVDYSPWMPSSSEVTTADWPRYIGQYSDFTQADSTNPSDYTWSLIRGNDGKDGADGHDGRAGKDGVGIKTTVITYAISTSGTTAPNTGWTNSVPSLVKGQYLWTKTVWTYSDTTSETGYSVTYIAKDGNNGHDGIAGKDGTGIKTTTITYAGSTSGTIAPASGWTSTVPTVAAGSYLWTKTLWTYTDNTSETGYSVAKMGNNGTPGPQGPPGSNGDPGKTVSNTEPTTRFKGLTWKYSGTTDLTASDGTVIKPNIEYYYNGTHWIVNFVEANQIKVIDLSSISGTFTNGSIKNVTIDGSVTSTILIEKKHILFTFSDSSQNTTNTLEL
ncbi:hypothetical protein, partial [Lactococcus lactis]|uniref:hypothetical protein n=1 Tax=Lactococcus lactis TaxID=1358 RepID=UPI001E282950